MRGHDLHNGYDEKRKLNESYPNHNTAKRHMIISGSMCDAPFLGAGCPTQSSRRARSRVRLTRHNARVTAAPILRLRLADVYAMNQVKFNVIYRRIARERPFFRTLIGLSSRGND